MRFRALRVTTCCLVSAMTIGSMSIPAVAAPIAGASGLTSVSVASELTSTSPTSGISLLLSQYLAENSLYSEDITKEETDAATVKSSASDTETADTEDSSDKSDTTSQLAVARVDGYVNVRAKAKEDSSVVGKLYNNSVATIVKTKGDWYKITSGSVTGFVKSDYVVVGDEDLLAKVGTRTATVNTTTLKVRSKASTKADVMELVPEGEELTVTDESKDGWIKVSVESGYGFVSTDFVSLSTEYTYAESKAEEEARLAKEEEEKEAANEAADEVEKSQSNSSAGTSSSSSSSASDTSSSSSSDESSYSAPSGSNGSAVANYACQFIGNPYVYGGTSLTNGCDCSGFVMSVYAAFGVSLPHSSSGMRSVGRSVSLSEIQPGDIVCYSGHVGIYVGNNTIVNASTPETGIKYTSPVTYRSVVAVRRIF